MGELGHLSLLLALLSTSLTMEGGGVASMQSNVTPTNVTFNLEKQPAYSSTSDVYVGSMIGLRLVILFPIGLTDINVELFTPDNETTLMVICDPKVTSMGSNLVVTTDPVTPLLTSKDHSQNYDQAILDLGEVTNSGLDQASPEASQLVIEWSIVMIDTDRPVNGSVFYVSAGAEYYNGDYVWIGQAALTTILDNYVVSESPAVNISGPDSVPVGGSAVITVDMYLPVLSDSVTVNLLTPTNASTMSICHLAVVSVGTDFLCTTTDSGRVSSLPGEVGTASYLSSLTLDIVNTGLRSATPNTDSVISVQAVVQVLEVGIGDTLLLGATVAVGSNRVWAGELPITAAAPTTPTPTSTLDTLPTFSVSESSSTTLSPETATQLVLHMEPPVGELRNYQLEVLAPYNDSARMQLCKVEVISYGVNLPCYMKDSPVYASRDPLVPTMYDKATLNLGYLINHNISTKSGASSLQVEMTLMLLDHSLNIEGEELWVTTGIYINDQQVWVGRKQITITTTPYISQETPVFNMRVPIDHVHVGASTLVSVDLTVPPATTLNPLHLHFLVPTLDDTPVFSICRAELVSVGGNLPCVNREVVNASIQVQESEYGVRTSGSVNLTSLCNIGSADSAGLVAPPTDDDRLTFNLSVSVLDVAGLQDATQQYVASGTRLNDTQIWLGLLDLTVITDPNIPTQNTGTVYRVLESVVPPQWFSAVLSVIQHQAFSTSLIMKIPHQSTFRVSVSVSQGTCTGISLCLLRVAEAGYNLPCTNTSLTANVTWDTERKQGQTAEINLNYLTNHGWSGTILENSTFDENSVRVELIGHAVTIETCIITWTTTVDGVASYIDQDIQVSALNVPSTGSPNLALYTARLGDAWSWTSVDSVSVGESVIVRLDVTPTDCVTSPLTLTFISDVSDVEMCHIGLVHAGRNIPCLQRGGATGQLQATGGSVHNNQAVIDLAALCSFPIDTDELSTKVTVEVVARLLPGTSVSPGDSLSFTVTSIINNMERSTSHLQLTVAQPFTEAALNTTSRPISCNININDTSPQPLSPGDVYTMTYTVTIPPNMTHDVTLDAVMPVNVTACMTVNSLKVVGVGRNLGCTSMLDTSSHHMTLTSSHNTSQTDVAYLHLGVITNSGFSYRIEDYKPGDDEITVEAVLQMADCPSNVNGSLVCVSFGVHVTHQVDIVDMTMMVRRTGEEEPDIEHTTRVITAATAKDGDEIEIESCIQHLESSSAEVLDLEGTFFLLPQLELVAVICNHTSPHTLSTLSPATSFSLMWSHLFFSDVICCNVTLRVNSRATDAAVPRGTGLSAVPYQARGTMYHRDGSMYPASHMFYSHIQHFNVSLTLSCPHACSGQPLGMETNLIRPCQLTGSTSTYDIQLARRGAETAWRSGTRYGDFAKFIQVDFVILTEVTGVWLYQPDTEGTALVTEYRLLYTDNLITWTPGELVSTVGRSHHYNVSCPQMSRYLRLEFTGTDRRDTEVTVQTELYGCPTPTASSQDVCSTKDALPQRTPPLKILTDLLERSVLVIGTMVFACDHSLIRQSPSEPEGKMTCQKTTGCGDNIWLVLDVVGYMVGYDPHTDRLLGVSTDRLHYVISPDAGDTFYSISVTMATHIKASDEFIPAVHVPWTNPVIVEEVALPPTLKVEYEGLYCNRLGSWVTMGVWC